jgi:hypothetical protein
MIDKEPDNPSLLLASMGAAGIRYETEITLRDMFAAIVSGGIAGGHRSYDEVEDLVDEAYLVADAMLKRRAW